MRIERLEVFGFKSFMERLTLPMENGITGVVGPNGCGKSNIVDALRWVLGETRASQLRGGVLEDVIFNGTESLRPLGLAEVSLTIRAERGTLYEDLLAYYESVEASSAPRVAHSVEAILDGAAASNQDDVVSQESGTVSEDPEPAGQVPLGRDESANTDALEGPQVQQALPQVEAGEMPVQGSVEEPPPADDFLADIRASLSKYTWLRSVSEVQITRRLYRSGESEYFINRVPSRLKDLKELFRVVGLAARGYTIIAQGEIGRIVAAKPEDRRQVIEEAAHIAGFREHMNAVGKRLEDTQAQVLRIEDVIKEVTRQVAHLKRQANRAVARAEAKEELIGLERSFFVDSLARLAHRVRESTSRVDAMQAEETSAAEAFQLARAAEQLARDEAVKVESQMEGLRNQADRLKDELGKRQREVSQKESRVRELQSVLQARNTEIRRLEERRAMLAQRLSESREALGKLITEETSLGEQVQTIDMSAESEIKELQTKLHQMREEQRVKDRAIREVRDTLVSAQSRRDAIQAQLAASSPLTHLKKALGGEHKLPGEITSEARVLVDGITVPPTYAKALQAVLAERASFLVVPEVDKAARSFIDLVVAHDPTNKRGIGLGLFEKERVEGDTGDTATHGGGLPEKMSQVVAQHPQIRPLIEVVQCESWCQGVVRKLLGGVFLAEDTGGAFAFFDALKSSSCGAIDHELVVVTLTGDLISSWSFYSLRHEGGVVQMKIKVDEAQATLLASQVTYDALAVERDALLTSISDGEKRYSELVRSLQQAQAKLREIGNRQGEVRGRLQSERRMNQQLEGDIARIQPQMDELRNQLTILEREISDVSDALALLRGRDNSEVEQALKAAVDELKAHEDARRRARESMGEVVRSAELKRQALEAHREKIVRERMHAERARGELSAVEQQVKARLGHEFLKALAQQEDEVPLLEESARRSLEDRVVSLRTRLEREGEVDPTSIEQYEAENLRLTEITTQKEDLVTAAETLRVTLAELSEACTKRFALTFEAIRRNFAEFGPKLFGGGSAELSLIDPSRPLETGVDILVRPPGKKPKSIDLLSGGEKALCATALVFSMFMVRPSPLCVLDEVDAPLDEANVHRFVSFIKEMSARTQFLMVTHNKQSMAAADTLIGVTMPQPGASRVLTVSLQEAVKQVA